LRISCNSRRAKASRCWTIGCMK